MRRKSKKMDLYEYTLEETAKELGCSPERVQQILNEALAKIRRNPATLKALREYWQWSTERRQGEGFVARDGIRL